MNFEPYRPGNSIEQIRRQYGLKTIIKLASNENSLGPSPEAMTAYKKAVSNLNRYPESMSLDLRRFVAEKFKRDMSEVIIGSGSNEVIEMLGKAFLSPANEIVVSASSFYQFRSAGHLMGSRVVTVPMKEMKHDLMAMAKAVTLKTKLVFVANPNNPTGTYNSRAEVEEFLIALPEGVLPVFDEAYFEYASVNDDYPSIMKHFFNHRPMVVLRTFSKVYGLAGLRVGYGLAPEGLVEIMDKIRPPFNVSLAAQAAAQAALYDDNHVKQSVQNNNEGRTYLEKEFGQLGLKWVPSAANFILFSVPNWTGEALFKSLLQRGIIARAVNEYGLPEYLRVTIGKPSENKAFIKALKEVIKKK